MSNYNSKGLNIWLENKVKSLQEELSNTKTNFENLEIIYKNYSCRCVVAKACKSCESLQKKVEYLIKTFRKY